jgi:tetratricopeptide (TPR) repeat protein
MEPIGIDWERIQIATPRSFEAGAWASYTTGDWKRALRFSLDWLRDQPFSIRPVLFGSCVAVSILEDYRSSERIIEVGLRANPDEPILLNNLAFGYASAGLIDKAEQKFSKIDFSRIREVSEEVAITATQGLLFFRRGYQKEGRTLYRRAIEHARKLGLKSSIAIASIYLAREEILSESDEVEKAIESAMQESRNIADPAIQTILDKVLEMKKQDGLKLSPRSPRKETTN